MSHTYIYICVCVSPISNHAKFSKCITARLKPVCLSSLHQMTWRTRCVGFSPGCAVERRRPRWPESTASALWGKTLVTHPVTFQLSAETHIPTCWTFMALRTGECVCGVMGKWWWVTNDLSLLPLLAGGFTAIVTATTISAAVSYCVFACVLWFAATVASITVLPLPGTCRLQREPGLKLESWRQLESSLQSDLLVRRVCWSSLCCQLSVRQKRQKKIC